MPLPSVLAIALRRLAPLSSLLIVSIAHVSLVTGGALAEGPAARVASPPNILWIVWDTVRADRMSLYGYERATTPNLERLAAKARVYDCLSTGGWTPPSHASMFTGLFPGEHGVNSWSSKLRWKADTAAERLLRNGYQTYLYSANPLVSRASGLAQGFQTVEHPFDDALAERARELVKQKMGSAPSEWVADVGDKWALSASGALGNERVMAFLRSRDRKKPFFAFLNYVEAHRPRIPARKYRERFLSQEDVIYSYEFDQSQTRFQAASFGLIEDFSPRERAVVEALYDASLAELDDRLGELFAFLEHEALLEDTVVILVSDHGEHLGDHGSYLHQFSLYESIVRVPLVIWAEGRVKPGRDPDPVMSIDLFPTVMEVAGQRWNVNARPKSLLRRRPSRSLYAEYTEAYEPMLAKFEREYESFDGQPFRKSLIVAQRGSLKAIRARKGAVEVFDLATDPHEKVDLRLKDSNTGRQLLGDLNRFHLVRRRSPIRKIGTKRTLGDDEADMLQALGYVVDPTEESPEPVSE